MNAYPPFRRGRAIAWQCLWVLGLLSGSLYAQPITLATGDNYFPFVDQRLPYGGWSRAIVETTFAQMDQTIETTILPWPRVTFSIKQCDYDAGYAYIQTPERHADFLYSEPLLHVHIKAVVHQYSPHYHPDDLRKQIVCTPYGFALTPTLEQWAHQKNNRVQSANQTTGCLLHVAKKRSDVALVNHYFQLHTFMRQHQLANQLRLIEPAIVSVTVHLIAPRHLPGSQRLITRFNQALASLRESGQLAALNNYYEQYILPYYSPNQ